jgi:hypothetical protein
MVRLGGWEAGDAEDRALFLRGHTASGFLYSGSISTSVLRGRVWLHLEGKAEGYACCLSLRKAERKHRSPIDSSCPAHFLRYSRRMCSIESTVSSFMGHLPTVVSRLIGYNTGTRPTESHVGGLYMAVNSALQKLSFCGCSMADNVAWPQPIINTLP